MRNLCYGQSHITASIRTAEKYIYAVYICCMLYMLYIYTCCIYMLLLPSAGLASWPVDDLLEKGRTYYDCAARDSHHVTTMGGCYVYFSCCQLALGVMCNLPAMPLRVQLEWFLSACMHTNSICMRRSIAEPTCSQNLRMSASRSQSQVQHSSSQSSQTSRLTKLNGSYGGICCLMPTLPSQTTVQQAVQSALLQYT